jgi:hypothetical protein
MNTFAARSSSDLFAGWDGAAEIGRRRHVVKALEEAAGNDEMLALAHGGFGGLADFLRENRIAWLGGKNSSARLNAFRLGFDRAAKSFGVGGMTEFSESDGAGLIPGALSEPIWRATVNTRGPLGLCDRRTTETNSAVYRTWTNASLAAGSRIDEVTGLSVTGPRTRAVGHKLNKLYAYVEVSEELMEDAPTLDSDLEMAVIDEFRFALENEMINGNGGGQFEGILNAPATITIAAETGQGSGTIIAANIAKMWQCMPAANRYNAVWNVSEDLDPQLVFQAFAGGSGSYSSTMVADVGVVTFQLPGSVAGSPYAHLMGRPVIPTEQCPTLGSKGDIVLCDWSQYSVVTKVQPITKAFSAHVRFHEMISAFRYTMRCDGRPLWNASRAPLNGSVQRSPYVVLAARP